MKDSDRPKSVAQSQVHSMHVTDLAPLGNTDDLLLCFRSRAAIHDESDIQMSAECVYNACIDVD